MFTHLLVLFAIIAVAFAGAPSSTKVSASVKETTVNGVEGLNVNIAAPFKFNDYVVGFRYALGDLKRAPESLFAKRTFDTAGDGQVTVDSDYNLEDKVVSVSTKWSSDSLGMSFTADADTKDRLRSVGVSKETSVNDNKLTLRGAYDLLKKKFNGESEFNVDATKLNLKYDSENRDPVLSVTRGIDERNEVSPSVSLKNGDVSYGYTRKWDGGSLKSKLFPGDKVEVEWTDNGSKGTWTTTAEVPLDNRANTKVSFGRDWDY